MNAADIALAYKEASKLEKPTNHSFLYYGPPKSGKTELVATLAKSAEYDKIYWFDIEKGFATVLRMYRDGKLTLDELRKIEVIDIPDTREDPVAVETLLKTLCSKHNEVLICEEHGRVNCEVCKKAGKGGTKFKYSSLTKKCAVVIDSLSQVGTSALNLACKGKPSEYKPGFDEYGACGKWLSDICTVLQAAQFCDIHAITHVQILEDENKNDIYYPLCGTKAFSANVAKFFGTVVFVTKKLKRHRAESSTLTSMNTLSGSRLGIELEKDSELDLPKALRKAGFFRPIEGEETEAEAPATESKPAPTGRFGRK